MEKKENKLVEKERNTKTNTEKENDLNICKMWNPRNQFSV